MSGYKGRGIHGHTVEVLGARIVNGNLMPDEILDLSALGKELDLSLTSLREAIKVLMAKGLVDARQKRGTFVKPRVDWNALDSDVLRWQQQSGESDAIFKNLTEIRASIEPNAAILAAERRTEEDIERLHTALDEMRKAASGSAHEAAEADFSFHHALLRATQNELFAQMGSLVVEPALFVRDKWVHDHTQTDPLPAHELLVETIIEQDVGAAKDAAWALLDQSVADVALILGKERGATE